MHTHPTLILRLRSSAVSHSLQRLNTLARQQPNLSQRLQYRYTSSLNKSQPSSPQPSPSPSSSSTSSTLSAAPTVQAPSQSTFTTTPNQNHHSQQQQDTRTNGRDQPNSSGSNQKDKQQWQQSQEQQQQQQKSSKWRWFGPFKTAADAYARAMRSRPYTVQIASAVIIFAAADASAQYIRGTGYDPLRTARSMLIGAGAAVPQYKWFIILSHNLNYRSRILSLAVKVIINQLVFTPLFSTYFFGSHALLQGDSLSATYDRLLLTLPASWVNSWKVWPAVSVFCFTWVPLHYRSLVTGVVAIGWQTYLSFLNRRAEMLEAKKAMALEGNVEATPTKQDGGRDVQPGEGLLVGTAVGQAGATS